MNDSTEVVSVTADGCGQVADCTATNKRGTASFTAPGTVIVPKAHSHLTITCRDQNGSAQGSVTMKSNIGAEEMAGNALIFGGVIGLAVDAQTAKGREYPDNAHVQCRDMSADPI